MKTVVKREEQKNNGRSQSLRV